MDKTLSPLTWYYHSPSLQDCGLQVCDSEALAGLSGQSVPLKLGAGLSQVRVLTWVPPSHVTVHEPHADQLLQLPSIAAQRMNFQWGDKNTNKRKTRGRITACYFTFIIALWQYTVYEYKINQGQEQKQDQEQQSVVIKPSHVLFLENKISMNRKKSRTLVYFWLEMQINSANILTKSTLTVNFGTIIKKHTQGQCINFKNLRQGWGLQLCDSEALVGFPGQSVPLYRGAGLSQVRFLNWVPPPHVTLHVPQVDQSLQIPLIAVDKWWLK
jgi:hypothetical protein